ncbi:MAG: hypothetical protein GTO45_36855 [Candidatus Aminicenantes bacterium]|nr:hypothetical protein [Candidatus Aminicenantes bacterium]NIM78217.1 hypothetical protein [Candidatus Aminicenantes bacterium]NIN23723.1 hypothetical protein [Candidatus Aminicenantes bacterium]NIN47430.1 hypothetical protein [Candidatus Aminicenantes bacterium]NIN90358.1 hypothetical protein [Candidatus Aminicenantes bacterium]
MKNIEPILCVFLLSVVASIPVFAAVIELPEIINPGSITVDNDHIYITDFPSVYIYSLKDYHLIKKFGRRGEGPGEWLRYALLSRHENYLVIGDQNKMLFFSTTGDYIKEIKAKSIIYWGGRPAANGFIAESRTTEKDFQYITICLYDQNLRKTKEIYRNAFFWQYKKSSEKCDAIEVGGIQFQTYNDYILFRKNRDFTIDVLDKSGEKLYTIQHPYSRLTFPDSIKKQYHQYFQTAQPWKRLYPRMEKEIHFPSHLPAIQNFVAADNKIYVLTYETRENQSKFIILDLKGKKLNEVWLPLRQSDQWFQHSLTQWVRRRCSHPTYTIKNNFFYHLEENEDTEQWELQVTKIIAP